MKIGVSSYSFARYLKDGTLDYFGCIEKAAEIGFDGIEFSSLGIPADDPRIIPLAGEIAAACRKAGLAIFSYTIPADFLRADTVAAEAKRLEGEVKVAAELGVPAMRHDATQGFPEGHKGPADWPDALPKLIEGCRAVTEFAAGVGVKTMVENHGFFAQDSDRCESLVKGVDHPNFAALVDIGNFLCADEDPVSAVTRLAPYAAHCHAKDFHVKPAGAADPGEGWFKSRGGGYLRGSIIGHGNVDVPGCIAVIKAAGYAGPLSIEFEGMEENYQALKIGLANLRRYAADS